MNRPPPYFPQKPLSPQSDNRYKKFKLIMAFVIIGILVLLAGIGFGIYYLIDWMF